MQIAAAIHNQHGRISMRRKR